MTELGIVIIGRNEGARLVRCLQSITSGPAMVYVDSGSSDGSVAEAKRVGARVVELDMATPFTAARARNAGRAALPAGCTYIQFVDGDCALQPGWLDAAQDALRLDERLAAVFGRRREVAPEASRYNWMCDIEWAVPAGPARYFGGDVMLRAAAFDQAGGYPDEMIAGEEPDLAIRLRRDGWTIACLPVEMTLHDAAITRFAQWWRRTFRSGHAYAELSARHRSSALSDHARRLSSVIVWGAVLPLAAAAAIVLGGALSQPWLSAAGGGLLCVPLVQIARLMTRERRRQAPRDALTIATFLMLAKPAQALGAARYWLARARGRRSTIIEYKGKSA